MNFGKHRYYQNYWYQCDDLDGHPRCWPGRRKTWIMVILLRDLQGAERGSIAACHVQSSDLARPKCCSMHPSAVHPILRLQRVPHSNSFKVDDVSGKKFSKGRLFEKAWNVWDERWQFYFRRRKRWQRSFCPSVSVDCNRLVILLFTVTLNRHLAHSMRVR